MGHSGDRRLMDPDHYQQELAPLLDAMSPAARFMVKAVLDEERGYSINLDPDDYRQAMRFFRSALDLALEHEDDQLAERVRRCRKRLGDPDVLLGGELLE